MVQGYDPPQLTIPQNEIGLLATDPQLIPFQ